MKIIVSEENKFKFLGIHLANNLKWRIHNNFIRNNLRVCLGIVYRTRDRLNTQCLLSIIHFLALSHINYCISTSCTSNATLVYSLQSFCNKILRVFFIEIIVQILMICIKNMKFLRSLTDTNSKFLVLYTNISISCYQFGFNNIFQFYSQICSRQTRSSNLLRFRFFT